MLGVPERNTDWCTEVCILYLYLGAAQLSRMGSDQVAFRPREPLDDFVRKGPRRDYFDG